MSSFFLPIRTRGKDRKRARQKEDKKSRHGGASKSKRDKKDKSLNEEVESDSDQEERAPAPSFKPDQDLSDVEETAPEKRLRLAKEYLARLQTDDDLIDGTEADTIDHDAIAHRLHDDVLEQAGRLQKKVADQYLPPTEGCVKFLKGHRLPVTVVTVTQDGRYAYSGSKDRSIIKWNLVTGKKEVILTGQRKGSSDVVGHSGPVMALAVSSDGKYMVSSGTDKLIHVWNGDTNLHQHTFRGHKDTVSGLVFQRGTHELFSCSFDRTVKIWNLDEMSYVETLFGHQDAITGIDCLSRERPVTAGASDKTTRVWKIVDESQLVFHGHKASIDSVRLINEEYFISGSQDGTVAVWGIMKKKPLVIRPHHQTREEEEEVKRGHWVTAVAALPSTDLVASGSSDGYIQLWKCGEKFKSLDPLFSVPMHGFVNSLVFTKQGDRLIAAVGQEHKLGRWWREKTAKNGIVVIQLTKSSAND